MRKPIGTASLSICLCRWICRSRGCALEVAPDQPYLGFKLKLDPAQLCDIIAQTNPGIGKKENSVRGWFISDADPALIDCAVRLTRLLDTPQDIPFLAPMIIREIYYRLLIGEQGGSGSSDCHLWQQHAAHC